jgi:hypothetical protein
MNSRLEEISKRLFTASCTDEWNNFDYADNKYLVLVAILRIKNKSLEHAVTDLKQY